MRPPKICCVGGCNTTSDSQRMFCFPKNDRLRALWLSFIVPTNSQLIGLTDSTLIKKRVCERHFDSGQFDYEGKRIRFAYPCLITEKEIAHGVPLATEVGFLNEHNYSREEEEEDKPAKSAIIVKKSGGEFPGDHDYMRQEKEDKDQPANSTDVIQRTGLPVAGPNSSHTPIQESPDAYEHLPVVEDLPVEDVVSPCPSPEVDEEETPDLPVTCNECHLSVTGHRFVCVSCSGCVVCVSCVTLGVHPTCYVLRVPPHRPLWEVQAVLQAVRSALAMSAFADQLAEPLAGYSIVDVKSECGDNPDLQDEEVVTEAASADPLWGVGADPLDVPFQTPSSVLNFDPVASSAPGARESPTSDIESQTDASSRPDDSGSDEDYIPETNIVDYVPEIDSVDYILETDIVDYVPDADCVEYVIETDAVADSNLPKRVHHLRSARSSKHGKVKNIVSEPLTSRVSYVENRDRHNMYKIHQSRQSLSRNRQSQDSAISAESQVTKQILANVTSNPWNLHTISLPVSSSKKQGAALKEIQLAGHRPKITSRKRPFEATSMSATHDLFELEGKYTSKHKTNSPDFKYKIAQKLPEVKVVLEKLDITHLI